MAQFSGARKRRKKNRGSVHGAVQQVGLAPEVKPAFGMPFQSSPLCSKDAISFPGFDYRVDTGNEPEVKISCRVVMSSHIYHKLFMYIKNTREEISGLGLVEYEGDIIRITDIFIVKQENTAGSTKLDNDDLAKLTMGLIKQYDEGDKSKNPSNMKLWWHSHASMGTHWSTTDDTTCDEYNNDTWLLSIVANHDRDLLCRLDVYSPARLTCNHIPVEVISDDKELTALEDECRKEISEKCARKTYPVARMAQPQTPYNTYGKYGYPYEYEEVEVVPKKPITKQEASTITDWQEEYYNQQPVSFVGLTVYDEYKIQWRWDAQMQEYRPWQEEKCLEIEEYGFAVECIVHGITIEPKNIT